MTNFNKYSSHRKGYGVSGVVFGANSTILEAELNEMQEIQSEMLRNMINALTGITGKTKLFITNLDDIYMYQNLLRISKGATFIYDGYVLKLPSDLAIDTTGIGGTDVYLNITETIIDDNERFKIGGYKNATHDVTNWSEDLRGFGRTTNRKVIKFEISTMANVIKDSTPVGFTIYSVAVPIMNISAGKINSIAAEEININKLATQVNELSAKVEMLLAT